MTARTGMVDMIANLRSMTNAGASDYSIGLVDYWSDDQLQAALDAHRMDFYQADLAQITAMESGAIVWKTYRSPYRNLEGGTVNFTVIDGLGNVAGTADYSADYPNGIITFSANQAGKIWYLTARAYDIYAAAADVWRMKAAHASAEFDFTTDNHSIKGSQLSAQCLKMADYYERQSMMSSLNVTGGHSVLIDRSDT